MLIEVNSEDYHKYFPTNPHPFISREFIELNKTKTERVIWLVDKSDNAKVGLIAGLKNGLLQSPFSAPFGGFHFRNDNIYIGEIDNFIIALQDYIKSQGYKGIEVTLPPDIYHLTLNAKTISSLFRNGYRSTIPEITNWVNLQQFDGAFNQKNSRECFRQAVRNGLSFNLVYEVEEKKEIYNLIYQNRAKFGRPIFMTFKDLLDIENLWPVDFFRVSKEGGEIVASAIFYKNHPDISYAVFWGDNEKGRPLKAMDYLVFNLWVYFQKLGYKYIDLGISTESGYPNEGLLRFKESHEAISALRYRFFWENS